MLVVSGSPAPTSGRQVMVMVAVMRSTSAHHQGYYWDPLWPLTVLLRRAACSASRDPTVTVTQP
jgi:hypothetical protein